ncbi:hypothetical protein C4K25_5406 [Pseudomonas chlororaphis]|nr:hypothetical protein C4K25_5406 [Pseudomonas chlororaphis]
MQACLVAAGGSGPEGLCALLLYTFSVTVAPETRKMQRF